MAGALTSLGIPGAQLALLLLGHVLGDFLLQSEGMVAGKQRPRVLFTHVGVVTLAHLVAFAPFLGARPLGILLVLGASHLLIDAAKVALRSRTERDLALFTADQALHLAALLGAWWWLSRPGLLRPAELPVMGPLSAAQLGWMTWAAVVLTGLIFAHKGANAIVRMLLPDAYRVGEEDEVRTGRLIGTLERYLVIVLTIAAQWGAIALVLAAKSIARFEELKQRRFAEYYLVGTLSSMLLAVAVGLAVAWLV